MIVVKIKNLLFIVSLLFLTIGCKESVETPPFVFDCKVRFIDQDGNSLLQNNKDKANEVTVKMLEPLSSDIIVSVDYFASSDFLYLQIAEKRGGSKNKGNRLQDYIIQLHSPNVFSKQENDTIRIRYQFKDYTPSIIDAFFNDEKPESITTEEIVFKIKR